MDIAVIDDVHGFDEHAQIAFGSLILVFLTSRLRYFEQLNRFGIARNEQIAHVTGETCNEMMAIKPLVEHFVEEVQACGNIFCEQVIGEFEIVVVIQDVEVFDYGIVVQRATTECNHLVEYR